MFNTVKDQSVEEICFDSTIMKIINLKYIWAT